MTQAGAELERRVPRISPAVREEISAFILEEARLLDEGQFDRWASLFAEDGYYWVPAARGQSSPADHISLFYDDKPTILSRVARLRHPQIHVQTPPSRTCHVLSAVHVTEADSKGNRYAAEASFILLEYRPGHAQSIFGGNCRYLLRRNDDGFEIILKRVELVNCDDAFPALAVPF